MRKSELQVKALGMDVKVFDDAGHAVIGQPGELVCTSPFPSMPVGFWNDADGAKYRAAYFERRKDAGGRIQLGPLSEMKHAIGIIPTN